MKKNILLAAGFILFAQFTFAQKLVTREAFLKFHGATPLEDITASSNQAASVLDLETGALVFQVLMKSFVFKKALMQEHFNENYVESEKYPKAVFSGTLQDFNEIDLSKDGEHKLRVSGVMNIHGVDQPINEEVTLSVTKKQIKLETMFYMIPEDYNIAIPSAVRDKIAEKFETTGRAEFNRN